MINMGKEDDKKKSKDKDKDKKDKDKKDKDKKDKDKKDKDKDKDKKDKDKDKDKKDKDKDKDKEKKEKKEKEPSDWKIPVSSNLDNLIAAYEKIVNKFKDIDNYILKEAASKSDFIEKVKKSIADLPEATQAIYLAFVNNI
jgi:hypothetical protein